MTAIPPSSPSSPAVAGNAAPRRPPGFLHLGLRDAWRDWRGGELRALALAVLIAVAALACVGFAADRIRLALETQAAQLLGGDAVLSADHPPPPALSDAARAAGLATAEVAQFPSMALAHDEDPAVDPRGLLVSLKAVSGGYPLRGGLQVKDEQATATLTRPPAPGSVWIDPQIATSLDVKPGDRITLGDAKLTVSGLLLLEPDRGAGFGMLAPRVLMRLEDLPATGLVVPGARVGWRLLVAGDAATVHDWLDAARPQLARGESLNAIAAAGGDSASGEGNGAANIGMDRAQRYLGLAALSGAVLASVAMALGARRFVERRIDSVAVLRCLGATRPLVLGALLVEIGLVGLLAGLAGVAAGYVAHLALMQSVVSLITVSLPAPTVWPALKALAAGAVLLAGFALPALLRLGEVSPLRALRRELAVPQAPVLATLGLAAVAYAALMVWFAGGVKLGLMVAGGLAVALALFAGLAWLALRAAAAVGARLRPGNVAWRFALLGMARRTGPTVVQITALALGLFALLLLGITRGDLIDSWRRTLPPDAPNRFVINLQPDQTDAFNAALVRNGLPAQELQPMIRGRLIAINDTPVRLDDWADDRARRLLDREFNLSERDDAPAHNQIVAGQWAAPGVASASVEAGLMERLHLKMGDRLRFDIGGQQVEAPIGSVRKLDWNSMRVNFFVMFRAPLLADMPRSYITAFRMPEDRDIGPKLAAEFLNITIIDTGALVRQIGAMVDQLVAAVQFLFAFTVVAGLLVLQVAIGATLDERMSEAGLLRALGATRSQLGRAQALELLLTGGLAGLLAALAAAGMAVGLGRAVFDLDARFQPGAVGVGVAAGAVLAFAAGAWLMRGVLSKPPLDTLRAG
ncbi:ABC transporter permease [Derxia gummosa]|uniref:ABC transporter permease n=1 Tax=Derxia gummosa DSM 723 TaxID=1121388 RepID=A0A8B6X3F4_9BURK|nr:FtsX-like permease family protein [Derxia gummosa]